jgi:Bacterial Ig-like domain (group 2)
MKPMSFRAAAKHPAARLARLLAILVALPVSCSDNPTAPSAPTPRSLTVTIVPVDSEYQATATAAFSDGSSREVTREVQWTSTDTNVAVVSDTGRVTPVASGGTEIRGTYQNVSGSAQLTVAPPAPSPPTPETHHVTVRVIDALDLTAVSDARVTMIPAGQSEGRTGSTDRDGVMTMTAAWGGSVTVRAERNGYESQTVQGPVRDTTFILIRLKPLTFTLSGTAEETHSGDSPTPGPLRVEIVGGANAARSTTVPLKAGGPVKFEITNLQPGTFTVRASAPRYFPVDRTGRFGVDEGSNRLRLILFPMNGEHSFQPIAVNGPGVTATFFPFGPSQETSRTNMGFRGTAGMPVTVRVTNNAVGLVFVGLREGTERGFASTSSSSAAFNMSATLPDNGQFTIVITTASPAGGTLLVRLTSP